MGSDTATWGIAGNATAGYDRFWDAPQPPSPPSPPYVQAYFYYPDNQGNEQLLTQSYHNVSVNTSWSLVINVVLGGPGGENVTATWNASDVDAWPSPYAIQLETPEGYVDMRELSSYTYEGLSGYNFFDITAVANDSAPPTITDHTPSTAYTDTLFTFNASIDDATAVDAFVEYWFGDGAHTNASLHQIGGFWQKTVTVGNTTEELHYILSSVDIFGHWNATGIKDVSVVDVSPPAISAVEASPAVQQPGGWVNVTCGVEDNVQVGVVMVNVSFPDGSWVNASMSQGSHSHYYYNDSYSITGTYTYRVYATDTSGNGNHAGDHSFQMLDIDPPEIDLLSPTGGESARGEITITWSATDVYDSHDNITIDIFYSSNGGTNWEAITQGEENDGEYSWDTSSLPDGQHYVIRIRGTDSGGNEGVVAGSPFTIDNTPPSLTLVKPGDFLYLFNREIIPLPGVSVVIGDCLVEVEADDQTTGVQRVEFWMDGVMQFEDRERPYQWMYTDRSFRSRMLEVVASDQAGNSVRREQQVTVINLGLLHYVEALISSCFP